MKKSNGRAFLYPEHQSTWFNLYHQLTLVRSCLSYYGDLDFVKLLFCILPRDNINNKHVLHKNYINQISNLNYDIIRSNRDHYQKNS